MVFLFPGQGTQYVNMGLELYRHEAVFREQVEHCATLLLPHLGCDIRQVFYPGEPGRTAAQQLLQTRMTQPALFVIEYALAQLWITWGIRPQAMLGHSLGEYVAACLAGVFSLQDALALVAARGRLMQQLPGGAMLAVALTERGTTPPGYRDLTGSPQRPNAVHSFRSYTSTRQPRAAAHAARCGNPPCADFACVSFRDDGADHRAVSRHDQTGEDNLPAFPMCPT